ncbi:MAG TPA: hypothetical protein V6C97_24000 [Oculatellaceae cyanobacterium]
MDGSIEQREDGSIRLLIKGDLQFDSHDEIVYHEALALPALSAALSRSAGSLRALIIGGGDGLIARELLRSDRVQAIDLVDYDPQILEFARTDFACINQDSLTDPRMSIHVCDAWGFVEDAVKAGDHYDLIVSDLTVPEDVEGARFHTVEWYQRLSALSGDAGILAINSCSPQATPRAFWSIFNGLLKASLLPRASHVHIPSFSAMGYGEDWGFILASQKNIEFSEISESFSRLAPRQTVRDLSDLKKLFSFPEALLNYQRDAVPAAIGSDVLLGYFYNEDPLEYKSEELFDAFSLDLKSLSAPDPDSGNAILPAYANRALMGTLLAQSGNGSADSVDIDKLLSDVVEMVPAIYRDHSPQIVADFLREPAAFLRGLDLCALVSMLLQRAKQLPARLVDELHQLRFKLSESAGESLDVFQFGHRVLALLTLAVVLGNLLYPDMVYAKGSGAHESAASKGHAAGARRSVGVNRGYGYGNYGYNNTYWVNKKKNPGAYGPGPGAAAKKDLQKSELPPKDSSVQDKQRLRNRLASEAMDASNYLNVLRKELSEYNASTQDIVIFGTHEVSREDAIRRTQSMIANAGAALSSLHEQTALLEDGSAPVDDNSTNGRSA